MRGAGRRRISGAPEAEGCARNRCFMTRNLRPDDEALFDMTSADVPHACKADRAVPNAVRVGMAGRQSLLSSVAIGDGQLSFRRKLQVRIEREFVTDAALADTARLA